MKTKFFFAALSLTPLIAMAEPIPKIGNIYAIAHQKCGKNINILIGEPEGADLGRVVIAINNKKTKNIDYFLSTNQQMLNYIPSIFNPVIFDKKTNEFMTPMSNNPLPSISWGREESNWVFHLTIGEHVYNCGKLLTYADESANAAYGE